MSIPPFARAFAVPALVLTAGCGLFGGGSPEQPFTRPPPPPQAAPEPAFAPLADDARLYYDNGGGIQDSTRVVIRDERAFRDVWSRATSRQSSPPRAPSVDFAREMVIVAGAGRMTLEDEIRVDSVGVRRESGAARGGADREVLIVVVRTTVGCGRFRSDAWPVEIAKVRRFDGEVRFRENRVQDPSCDPTGLRP